MYDLEVNIKELSFQEKREIGGGDFGILEAIAVGAALYGFGYALGKALYHATN